MNASIEDAKNLEVFGRMTNMREVMIIIENQRFFVSVRVHRYWDQFQGERNPDTKKWERIVHSLPVELQTQFISLLLAKVEEEGRRTNWMNK